MNDSSKLSTDAILMVLNDYAKRHLETSLVYQVAKTELQAFTFSEGIAAKRQ